MAPRQQVRAAARSFVRRHGRDDGYLCWVLRSVGSCSALAVVLLGLSANPASAELAPFGALTGAANPLNGLGTGPSTSARAGLGDLDGDGDLDLVAGEFNGGFAYFKNHGNASTPAFGLLTGTQSPLAGEDVGSTSAPGAGDLDGDGDTDLASGTGAGTFAVHYFPEPARALLLGAGSALLALLRRRRG